MIELARARRRRRPSRLLLRLRARGVPRRQPAAGAGRVRARRAADPGASSMPRDFFHGSPRRHCSCRSSRRRRARSWGIGELDATCPRSARGCPTPGFAFVQLLPLNEMAERPELAVFGDERDGDRSDLHRRPSDVPTIAGARRRGRAAGERERAISQTARASATIDYAARARVKTTAFRAGVRAVSSSTSGRPTDSARTQLAGASSSDALVARRLHASSARCTPGSTIARGPDWDAPLRDRDPAALRGARAELAGRDSVLRVPAVARGGPVAPGARDGEIGVFGDFRSW